LIANQIGLDRARRAIAPALEAYRRSGADGPFGDPRRDHEAGMEGYYWRFTDAAAGRVVIALCGVCAAPDGRWALAALAAHPDGIVHTAVLERAGAARDSLGVRAGDAVVANEREVRFDLGIDAQLAVAVRDPWRWPQRALAASGVAHLVPGLAQYWHPYLLGGRVCGEAMIGGRRLGLDGATVYAEKNWGPAFPSRWWWGHADAFDGAEVAVAFAGGRGRIAGADIAPTVVVLRLGERVLALRPPLARVVAGGSQGRWKVRARSARYSVELEADDPAASAVVLPVPAADRRAWEPLSHQALAGRLRMVVRRGTRTLFRGECDLAGLEHDRESDPPAPDPA
jgi:hypothetical protein